MREKMATRDASPRPVKSQGAVSQSSRPRPRTSRPADVACGRNDQRARADCERWYADAYAIPRGVGQRLRGGERARATRRGCERPFVGGRRGFGSSGFGRRDALIRWREHGASCAAGRFPDAFVGGLGDGGLGCRRRGRPLAVFRAAADGCREVGENWG